jgi:hypothetical protein
MEVNVFSRGIGKIAVTHSLTSMIVVGSHFCCSVVIYDVIDVMKNYFFFRSIYYVHMKMNSLLHASHQLTTQ